MNEMSKIEQVARAIAEARRREDGSDEWLVSCARAAIAVMMEPTRDMTLRGGRTLRTPGREENVADAWRAMVAAALQDPA